MEQVAKLNDEAVLNDEQLKEAVRLERDEVEPFRLLFHKAAGSSSTLPGAAAVAFFSRSGLPNASLKQIWAACDRGCKGHLTRPEFILAARLIALAQIGYRPTIEQLKGYRSRFPVPKFELPENIYTDDFDMTEAEKAIKHEYDTETGKWKRTLVNVVVEKKPFAEGAMRAAYQMRDLSESGDNSSYVLKIAKMAGTPVAQYFDDVKMQTEAQKLARAFNAKKVPKPVQFIAAYVMELIDRPNRPICGVERFVPGTYVKYNNNWDWSDERRNTPQAFSHFSWEESAHTLLVCDIQGVADMYTDPQIHSINGVGYGQGNLGVKGIMKFLDNHTCNHICRFLRLPAKASKKTDCGTVVQGRMPDSRNPFPRPQGGRLAMGGMGGVAEGGTMMTLPDEGSASAEDLQELVNDAQEEEAAPPAEDKAAAEAERLALERQELAEERKRLELDRQRFEQDKQKMAAGVAVANPPPIGPGMPVHSGAATAGLPRLRAGGHAKSMSAAEAAGKAPDLAQVWGVGSRGGGKGESAGGAVEGKAANEAGLEGGVGVDQVAGGGVVAGEEGGGQTGAGVSGAEEAGPGREGPAERRVIQEEVPNHWVSFGDGTVFAPPGGLGVGGGVGRGGGAAGVKAGGVGGGGMAAGAEEQRRLQLQHLQLQQRQLMRHHQHQQQQQQHQQGGQQHQRMNAQQQQLALQQQKMRMMQGGWGGRQPGWAGNLAVQPYGMGRGQVASPGVGGPGTGDWGQGMLNSAMQPRQPTAANGHPQPQKEQDAGAGAGADGKAKPATEGKEKAVSGPLLREKLWQQVAAELDAKP